MGADNFRAVIVIKMAIDGFADIIFQFLLG